jgi:hypothetical protein
MADLESGVNTNNMRFPMSNKALLTWVATLIVLTKDVQATQKPVPKLLSNT